MALDIREATAKFKIPHKPEQEFQIRAGVHSGACMAGVVGLKMPRYVYASVSQIKNTSGSLDRFATRSKGAAPLRS